ncbi:MAG: M20/M25/M40 family metallo-hydrolase [Deltaproteobacteria bacterium]|nr:M20/M25/M40 family metallo-hydrolase [Deltaproteobacteria bacterium]
MTIPHGVAAMSTDIDGLVETSNNEATLVIEDGTLSIQSSQRSSVMSRLRAHTKRIEGIARLAGGTFESGNGYPAWQPNMASELLERCATIYREMFDKEPVVEAIHAGLECGIIGSKYDGMDMISFGPTIKNPHSPDEKIYVPSIALVWDYLVAILASYAAEGNA